MSMPNHLVMVRHGESEGNFVHAAHINGDNSYLTDEYRQRQGHEWRITPKGVEQAQAAGIWITQNILEAYNMANFDLHLYSPHRRCRETAGHLELPNASWRLNRLLREREWGELAGLLESEHAEKYPENYAWMKADPLHWAPVGGESISQTADNRVRGVFDTLHRYHENNKVNSVVCAAHGEFMWASDLLLDYMLNEDYQIAGNDKSRKINNGQVVHRTRLSPEDGEQADYLKWHRSVWPWANPDDPGVWHESSRKTLTNEELLAQAESLPRLFDD
jgi:broad specificity phosphatase PhoE